MESRLAFFPQEIYGLSTRYQKNPPGVLIFPNRYIQGPGVLDYLGKYLSLISSSNPALLVSAGGRKRFGNQLKKSFETARMNYEMEIFNGECCYSEFDRLVGLFNRKSSPVDAVIAVGGGKCLDTGKCVAFRLDVPVVICPTIASTDAPCSAVSVVYTPEGVQIAPEFFPNSPALVVLDTQIIINAPVRQLVSGMGDALATYYEVRTCYENSAARSVIGGRITMTTLALARLCAETVMEHGLAAADAVRRKEIIDPFEKVVEANSLLSGVGFESGGLSTAHAVAAGLTVISALHKGFFHGELVSMGLLVHLLLEKKEDEALEVARFAAQVGLPVHAGQLDLDLEKDAGDIRRAMEGAVASGLPESEPFPVTTDDLVQAFTAANGLGLIVFEEIGDQAYRDLHP